MACRCPCCDGVGTIVCHQCGGTRFNVTEVGDERFQNERGLVFLHNGVSDLSWLLRKGGPCWLCKAQGHVGCADCSGTGIKGGVDRFTGD